MVLNILRKCVQEEVLIQHIIILYKIFFTKCPITSWQDRPAVVQ